MRRSVGYFGAGMDPKFTLPSEMVRDASISGNEYGWPLRAFPNAVKDKFHHQHLEDEEEEKHSEQLGEYVGGHERQLLASRC